MKKHFIVSMAIMGVAHGLSASAAYAAIPEETPRKQIDRNALMGLAEQFVDRVGTKLDEAEGLLKHGGSPLYLRSIRGYDSLPDGETMLLQIALKQQSQKSSTKPVKFANPIMAVKEGRDAFISLADFVTVADFPIKIDVEKLTADGWFVRENQLFSLNAPAYTATINGVERKIAKSDMRVEDGDILVKSSALADWFGFSAIIDPQSQVMNIETAQAWPVQEKLSRDKKRQKRNARTVAEQPYVENPYRLATVPNVRVNLQQRVSKPAEGPDRQRSAYSVIGKGDLLKHSAEGAVTGSNEAAVESVFLTLSKSSEEPELLGRLKARHYEFNDIAPVRVPYANNTSREQGFRVTNKNPYTTTDSTTVVDGFTQPGWDVELYRDQVLVGITTADEIGFYSFNDVILFAGDNKLRVVQYGPQGQVQEEEAYRNVALSGQTGIYDVSMSLQNTRTYDVNETRDPDKNTPNLAGTYETFLGDNLTLRTGLSALEQHGDLNVYGYGGLVTMIDDALVNADLLVTDEATFTTALLARKRLGGGHSIYGRADYSSEGFTANPTASGSEGVPSRYALSANMTGPLWVDEITGRGAATYFGQATYIAHDSGYSNKLIAGGIGTKLGGVSFSTQLSASQTTQTNGNSLEQLEGDISFSGYIQGFSWRSSTSFYLFPEARLDTYSAGLSKQLTPNLQGDVQMRHVYEDGYTAGSLGLSWFNDHVRVSPYISYDNEGAVEAKLSVGFGLARDPESGDILMSSKGDSSGGGVSAHVFLDKDGDGVYSKGDEPLKEVQVSAVQSGRRALSNEEGRAFVSGLAENRITDIVIAESSEFEQNWISANPGISLRPRPGTVVSVDFPILQGGSMDGTIYIAGPEGGEPRTAENLSLFLVTPDGKVEKDSFAAYDGFYTFEQVRPGVYYLVGEMGNSGERAYMTPQRIVFTPEGEVMYGKDIIMRQGYNIDFRFRALNAPQSAGRKTRVQRADEIARQYAIINIGPYHSDIMTTLAWYKMNLQDSDLLSDFNRVKDDAATPRDEKSGEIFLSLSPRSKLPLDKTGQACEKFIDAGYGCGVEIVTEYKQEIAAK